MSVVSRRRSRKILATAVGGLSVALSLSLAGCAGSPAASSSSQAAGPVELTWFQGSGVDANLKTAEALATAFMAKNPDIKIINDASGPSDSAIDNMIKTRLATGEMADMFWYNSGSLLQTLNPDQTMLSIKDDAFTQNLSESFVQSVSTAKGVYGVPVQTAGGGGIFYNIPIYTKLGLQVPKTWAEFMSNNQKIKAAGYDAVEQTYGDPWTSQIVTLADFYNVYAADNQWATKWTENKAKWATDPVAIRSFEKLQDLQKGGFFNKNFASARLDDGLKAVATGKAAHYPMLAFASATILANYKDNAEDVGFFPVPGDSADKNGFTSWSPPALYAPSNTPHPDAVKKFMAFIASPEGCDVVTETLGVTGPYMVKGCKLGDGAPRIIADMLPFYEQDKVAPALEFLSPVKGPSLQQLTVEVGSGIRDAKSAAQLYDEDAAKQAQQLGLPGW